METNRQKSTKIFEFGKKIGELAKESVCGDSKNKNLIYPG